MTDGFDVVPVRIQNERAVIVRMVERPRARGAVVFRARGNSGGVKRVDRRAVFGIERDMRRGRARLVSGGPEIEGLSGDPEERSTVQAEPGVDAKLGDNPDLQRRE